MSSVHKQSQARVVIAGAGFAALEAALALRAFANGAVHTYLLSSQTDFVFTPASTRQLFASVPRTHWPLHELAERAGAALVPGSLERIEPNSRHMITPEGHAIEYDYGIVAIGGCPEAWLEAPGLTFSGTDDVQAMGRELDAAIARAAAGEQARVVFVVPPGVGWVIPAYELALMARRYLNEHDAAAGAQIGVVTSEDAPLGVFGQRASQTVSAALADAGVELHTGAIVRGWLDGALEVVPDRRVPADVVISLPTIRGPRVRGLPRTSTGFVAADTDGRVRGEQRVFVAGDAGPFPVKQAGLACQQADRVAAAICRDLGLSAPTLPEWPVLRGLLWSGDGDHFLRRDLPGGRDESLGTVSVTNALWWPPGKVAGRFLTPFLHEIEALELVDVPVHH